MRDEQITHVWHDRMDWAVKTDGGQYWHRPLNSDDWRLGALPGISKEDMAQVFGLPFPAGLLPVA